MMSMAMLISPAAPMAIATSTISKRSSRCCWAVLRVTIRFWVSAECRKIACGITVAPRMPAARTTLSGPANLRHDRVVKYQVPGRPVDDRLHQVAHGHDADHDGDHSLQRPEAVVLQAEDQDGRDGGQEAGEPQRHPEEQIEAQGGAEELRQVRGHGDDFHEHPHGKDERPGEVRPALFGEVGAGGDPQLGRERLDQHRREVGGQHDPQKHVPELGAGRDVGGEVARIHVGDAGDEGRAQEWEQPGKPTLTGLAREDLPGGRDRPTVASAGNRGEGALLLVHPSRSRAVQTP